MLDTTLSAVGDVGALAAAAFAFLALGKANATIKLAESARVAAEQAAKDAAADRREAERDRMLRRIEKVGEILEAVAFAAKEPGGGRWQTHRNRLRQALVGLHERLPRCMALVNEVKMPAQVDRYIGAARSEVELELESFIT